MKKIGFFVLLSLICLISIFVYQIVYFHDGKLHVVFCNVGQGDSILIRTPTSKNILIDGGPDNSVLNCLSAHLPFWERKIDLVILTHPHADHFTGLYYVLDRYIASSFASERLSNSAQSFQTLMKIIGQKKIPERFILAGDKFKLGGNVSLNVKAPSQEMLTRGRGGS